MYHINEKKIPTIPIDARLLSHVVCRSSGLIAARVCSRLDLEILKYNCKIFSLNIVINLPKSVTGNLKRSTVFVPAFEMLVLLAQVISED